MVSLKVLILSAFLVSNAFSEPTLGAIGGVLGGLTGGAKHLTGGAGHLTGGAGHLAGGAEHLGGGLGGLGGLGGVVKDVAGGVLGGGILPAGPVGAVAGILKALAGGIQGKVGGVVALVKDLLSLKLPAVIDDVLNILRITLYAISEIVGNIFPGLGRVLKNVFNVIVRIVMCLLGSKGLTGAILGDHRPGLLNPANLRCNEFLGYKHGHGNGRGDDDCVDLTKYSGQLGIVKIIKEIEDAIASILGGRDINSLPRSQIVVVQCLRKLIKILHQPQLTKKDVTLYITISITIVAAITNSQSHNKGNELARHCVTILGPVLKKEGYGSLSGQLSGILKDLEGTDDDCNCWCKSNNADSQANGSQDSGSIENNAVDGIANEASSIEKTGGEIEGQVTGAIDGQQSPDDDSTD